MGRNEGIGRIVGTAFNEVKWSYFTNQLFLFIIMLERIHLAVLQEIEKQGSLTAAADKLCVTQSALSHR